MGVGATLPRVGGCLELSGEEWQFIRGHRGHPCGGWGLGSWMSVGICVCSHVLEPLAGEGLGTESQG